MVRVLQHKKVLFGVFLFSDAYFLCISDCGRKLRIVKGNIEVLSLACGFLSSEFRIRVDSK